MNAPENRANGASTPEATAEAPAPSARPIGGGVPAALLVSAIAVLVIVVSMPRFRAHVLDANREDAELTLGLLSGAVFRHTLPQDSPFGKKATTPGDKELNRVTEKGLYGLIQGVERLKHRFRDARTTGTAGDLLHHGYRFATGYVMTGHVEETALVAWPDTYGKTGDYAFAAMRDGSLYAHANRGLWSGADPLQPGAESPAPPSVEDLLPGGSQGLMNVDLSDESWIMIKGPSAIPPPPIQAAK